jgi:sterol desaturase/sphingolipid hydroxylase (fatty acid hydroxylase superfamily)
VHHAIEDLSAANYAHWTEEIQRIPFMTLPTILFIPSGLPALPLAVALATLQSQYIHAQTRLHLGPFWRLVYDNRFHRIHHSLEPRHFDKNFGVLTPLWDWLFGTLYVPAMDEWPKTGLADEREVDGFVDYLWRPFMPRERTLESS